jgi:hypothetical protein
MIGKRFSAIAAAAILSLSALLLAGCNSRAGWGVVLWSMGDEGVSAGSVVRVLTESHINNVYIVEREKGEKRLELPMWRLRKFARKNQAAEYAAAYAPYAPFYATAMRDGLPLRNHPDSGADQVYKLREGQVIKIIERVEGVPVLSGGEPLVGDWYRVLTEDGTEGFCFSYTLGIFDGNAGSVTANPQPGETAVDADLERVFTTQWRPEYFREMLVSGRFDLDAFDPNFGFFIDTEAKTASIRLPNSSFDFAYADVVKTEDGSYRFEDSQLLVSLKPDGTMTAEYPDRGAQKASVFVPFESDPATIAESERTRRNAAFGAIIKKGRELRSSSFGTLSLSPDGSFTWKGFAALQPAVVPAEAAETGKAQLRVYLGEALDSAYDGALSFAFDGAASGSFVNFLYKISDRGVQFEFLPVSCIEGIVATRRGASPLVMFFAY